jgi:hypothetical protein
LDLLFYGSIAYGLNMGGPGLTLVEGDHFGIAGGRWEVMRVFCLCNPETTTVFQDYVALQCEDRTFDCYANLALLKL